VRARVRSRRPRGPWVWGCALVVAAVMSAVVAGASLTADSDLDAVKPSRPRPIASSLQRQAIHAVALADAGARTAMWVDADGLVSAAVPDGSGGWFIGGNFSHVAGQRRAGLAHVRADGELDRRWAPKVKAPKGPTMSHETSNGAHALAVVGNTLYVGGDFTAINGRRRNGLAAVDATTGRVRAWNPRLNDAVWAVGATSGRIYAGGRFTRAGRASRRGLAAFDAATGALKPWNPGVTGRIRTATDPAVYTLLLDRGTLYIGGAFGVVSGRARASLAAFDVATGALTPWRPDTNDVMALAVWGDTVFLGGGFTEVRDDTADDEFGEVRESLAAVDARTGRLLPWQADAVSDTNSPAGVTALTVVGDRLFVGGGFTSLAGEPRRRLGVVNTATGVPIAWDPRPKESVDVLVADGDRVFVGGGFKELDG